MFSVPESDVPWEDPSEWPGLLPAPGKCPQRIQGSALLSGGYAGDRSPAQMTSSSDSAHLEQGSAHPWAGLSVGWAVHGLHTWGYLCAHLLRGLRSQIGQEGLS